MPCDGSTWSYDVKQNSTTIASGNCGDLISISDIDMSTGCQEYVLSYIDYNAPGNSCTKNITICPPKPCPKEGGCDLEVYVKDVTCLEPDPYGNQAYEVELDISGESNKHVCVFWNGISVGYIYPYLTIPFNTDVDLKVALCDDAQCTQNCDNCYKWIHLNKPDCRDSRFGGKKGKRGSKNENTESVVDLDDIKVIPNPVISNEIIIRSSLDVTDFEIYNSSGKIIHKNKFKGDDYRMILDVVPGLYFIRYIDSQGTPAFVKLIKL